MAIGRSPTVTKSLFLPPPTNTTTIHNLVQHSSQSLQRCNQVCNLRPPALVSADVFAFETLRFSLPQPLLPQAVGSMSCCDV